MERLEQGGTFVYRKLLSGHEKRKRDTIKRKNKRRRSASDSEDEETIDIAPSRRPRQVVKGVERHQRPNQLYVPRTSNSAALDAWMPQFGGFQMIVEEKHKIKPGAAADLKKLGENGDRLFFLLSRRYYDSFTKKTPLDIEPYAILIPYPGWG
ncbi:hypothetical protein PsorP6_015042 [Peronosclerospora sorghi]|uniref:Uncharacterized protein n=1 Tax=Peronosclerospora sorghi TaxID=230839 RepID=A0ACC0VSW7_9STRA|nr:hypothetical protein PsorP6_015042 [Peronosclerospora sorghi]